MNSAACTIRFYEVGVEEPIQTIVIKEDELRYGKVNAIIDDAIIKLERLRGSELLPYYSRRREAYKLSSLLRKAIIDDLETIRYILTAVFVERIIELPIEINVHYDIGRSKVRRKIEFIIDEIISLNRLSMIKSAYAKYSGFIMARNNKLIVVFSDTAEESMRGGKS